MSPRIAVFASLVVGACATTSATPPAPPAAADEDPVGAGKRWHALTRAKKADEARALCTPWLASPSKRLAAEGHECLAQVELIGSYKP